MRDSHASQYGFAADGETARAHPRSLRCSHVRNDAHVADWPDRYDASNRYGFPSMVLCWPERRLTVVVLTNRNVPPPYPLAQRIAALYR